jgi:hypothetical protein
VGLKPDHNDGIVYIDRKEVSMDANEITCPKCGHLNNYISEGCVKCGIIFSKYFEMQERERQLEAADTSAAGGETGTAAADTAEKSSGAAAPEPEKIEETITMDINSLVSESQDATPAEAAPIEEKPDQESVEISMSEIEMPAKTEEQQSESTADTGIDLPPAEAEKTEAPEELQPAVDEAATAGESSVDETGFDELIPEMKTEETPPADEVAADESPEPEKSETPVPAEEVLDLGQPLDKEKDNVIPLKTEPKEDKPESAEIPDQTADKADRQAAPEQVEAESAAAAGSEPASASAEEPAAEPAAGDDPPPAEEEAEILLEEVAEPAKADAAKAEEKNRIELLKKQKAALAKAAIAKKQKLAQAKKLEILKKQKAAQAKAEALKRQKAAALKKQKLQAQAEALKKQKAAQADAEISAQDAEAAVNQPAIMAGSTAANLKIMGLLKKYEGQTIGINYDNSADIKEAELVEANDEFFSVMVKETKLQYSYPLQTLLSLIEGEDGVQPEESDSKTKFSAVVKVYPLVLF